MVFVDQQSFAKDSSCKKLDQALASPTKSLQL